MAKVIDGKAIAQSIEAGCKDEVKKLTGRGIIPKLAIVVYNPSEPSRVYVDLKLKKAREMGIACELHNWSGKPAEECISLMDELAADSLTHGIIVQLPAVGLDNVDALLAKIPQSKDVDGLNPQNSYKIIPATPKAILELLKRSGVELQGRKIAIIGQGKLVGMPLGTVLRAQGQAVLSADSSTADIAGVTKQADVVISAVGKPGLIRGDMIKAGAVVIDAGTSEQHGTIVGDVDYSTVDSIAGVIAKVPGGVGPVTVACLLENVVKASLITD